MVGKLVFVLQPFRTNYTLIYSSVNHFTRILDYQLQDSPGLLLDTG